MGDNISELGPTETNLYRTVLAHPASNINTIAQFLDREPQDLDGPLQALIDIGLVRTSTDDSLTAISPMLAEATVLGAEDLEINTHKAAVEAKRNAIRRLIEDWNDVLSIAPDSDPSIELITDQTEVGNVMMHYADRCEQELLSISQGRVPRSLIDSRTRIANLYSAGRGVRSRLIYQQTALRDRHTRSYLSELADHGAKIRFATSVPGRSLVVDRVTALLPVPLGRTAQLGLVVVREPNVVNWVIATFEQMWSESQPLEDALSRHTGSAELDKTRAAILRLMAEGEKDEAISRRLSISVRTCRRQIADYMAQVGASSRFQAGVIAARSGHLDITPSN